MKMKIKNILPAAAGALALIGSFFLPNAVAAITDSRRLDNYAMVDSQRISFDATPELALPERIALVANPNAEFLALKTGQAMTFDIASERAVEALESFFSGGCFPFVFSAQVVKECVAMFAIDSENPSVNMIIWEMTMTDRYGNETALTIDDETGAILKIIYWCVETISPFSGAPDDMHFPDNAEKPENSLDATALRLSYLISAYYGELGLTAALADYQFSGSLAYYRADVSGEDEVIPMYGVVRATGFTMNERPA